MIEEKAKYLIEVFGRELAIKVCDEMINEYRPFNEHNQLLRDFWIAVKKLLK